MNNSQAGSLGLFTFNNQIKTTGWLDRGGMFNMDYVQQKILIIKYNSS